MTSLLEVKDLVIKFALRTGEVTATNGVSFTLEKGERLGLVGESGVTGSVAGSVSGFDCSRIFRASVQSCMTSSII